MSAIPSEIGRPYEEGLAAGELRYQLCKVCATTWLPARSACVHCLSDNIEWRRASGKGHVVTWVVYHKAYADHLKDRIPYDVTIVQIDEGPRVLTNIIDSDAGRNLRVGLPVELCIERENGVPLARFRRAAGELS
jgi:uncharacterized protein